MIEERLEGETGSRFGEGREFRLGCIIAPIVVVGIVAIVALASAAVAIDAGTVGVVKRFGQVTGRVLNPGLNWVAPFVDRALIYNTKEVVYEAAPEEKQAVSKANYVDYPVDTTTEDGQQVSISYSVRFRVRRGEAPRIAQELGDEAAVVEKVVKFHSRVLCRQIPRSYRAAELYTGDVSGVQSKIAKELRSLFEEKGIVLEAFGLRDITFSKEYVDAIEQKQIEKEKVTTEQYRADQAEYRKEAAITEAEGDAEAIRIKGEALKESPKMVQLEFVKALRDPESKVKVMVVPSEGVLPLLRLGALEGE